MRVNYILLLVENNKKKSRPKTDQKTAKLWEFYSRIEHYGNRRRRH